MTEREPTVDELREAEALARALDGASADPALPEDGLETAALLRFSRDGGTLSPDRAKAILDEVLASARPRPRRASVWRWLVPALAAALFVVALRLATGGPTPLPDPRPSLVRAQADAARPGARVARLSDEMRRHRSAVHAALSRRYLSWLSGCAGGADEWLERASEAHRRADAALARDDRRAARIALARMAHAPVPSSIDAEDARVVRQDLFARLSEVELGAGRARESARAASEGLALGEGGDVFTAALFVARGRARASAGEDLAAVDDYHRALVIDEALLHRALEEEDPR